MQYTPIERRLKLAELAALDPDCRQTLAELNEAQTRFERLTNHLPKFLRRRLWELSAASHIHHHRLLDLACQVMRFPEED